MRDASEALRAMLMADGALDELGAAGLMLGRPAEVSTPAPPPRIPPPPWADGYTPAVQEDTEPRPAKPKRSDARPRLAEARKIQAEVIRRSTR